MFAREFSFQKPRRKCTLCAQWWHLRQQKKPISFQRERNIHLSHRLHSNNDFHDLPAQWKIYGMKAECCNQRWSEAFGSTSLGIVTFHKKSQHFAESYQIKLSAEQRMPGETQVRPQSRLTRSELICFREVGPTQNASSEPWECCAVGREPAHSVLQQDADGDRKSKKDNPRKILRTFLSGILQPRCTASHIHGVSLTKGKR